jgi:hypothetical protein
VGDAAPDFLHQCSTLLRCARRWQGLRVVSRRTDRPVDGCRNFGRVHGLRRFVVIISHLSAERRGRIARKPGTGREHLRRGLNG